MTNDGKKNFPNTWIFESLISVKISIGYFLIYAQLIIEGLLPCLALYLPLGCINAWFRQLLWSALKNTHRLTALNSHRQICYPLIDLRVSSPNIVLEHSVYLGEK